MKFLRARALSIALLIILSLVGTAVARVYCCGLTQELQRLAASATAAKPCPHHQGGSGFPDAPGKKTPECPVCLAMANRAVHAAQVAEIAPRDVDRIDGVRPLKAAGYFERLLSGSLGSRGPPSTV